MAAAQAIEQRRVISRGVLGRRFGEGGGEQGCGCGHGGADGDAVQKVAARDGLVHAKPVIVRGICFFFSHEYFGDWGAAN